MTQPGEMIPAAGASAAGGRTEAMLRCWLMTALGLLLAAVALWDFRQGREFGFLRVPVLVSEIVAGAGIASCFGGAMYYVDIALGAGASMVRWYWRVLLGAQKRVLLVGQLAAAAIIVLSLGAIIFNKQIPLPFYPE